MKDKKLRKEAEDQLKEIPQYLKDLSKMETNELIHEFQVYQKELEMQNDELRQLQYRLEEVRDQYTDLFDFAPVGYFILDENGVIENANLTACSMLNIERHVLKKNPFSVFVSQREDSYQKFYSHLNSVFKSDELQSCVILMNKKKKEPFYVQIDSISEINEKGERKQCRLMIKDLTAEKKAENDIKKALEKEIKLNELKSRFVSMASHEFRTPLTSVLSSANLLDKYIGKEGDIEKQKGHVSRIRSSIFHLNAILNEFLSFDKLERGLMRVNISEFDICEVATENLDNFELMTKKDQIIKFAHRGPTVVNTDKGIIQNIFNNLLSNAIKYSHENTEIIFKTVVERDVLNISVEDAGIGIPKSECAQLFDRFYRAKNASNIEGSGLGLNIVKGYLDLLGGDISFESKVNKGTKFVVSIPL